MCVAILFLNDEKHSLSLISLGIESHRFYYLCFLLSETMIYFLFQVLDDVKNSSDHLVIDVFVVVILYAVTNRRKAIETLLRNKIRHGYFTVAVLQDAFQFYGQVCYLELYIFSSKYL